MSKLMPFNANKSAFAADAPRILWLAGVVSTFGFALKYHEQIQRWQICDPSVKNKPHRPCSMDSRMLGLEALQTEWDSLIKLLSVITVTGAVALAIPSPFGTPNLNWFASALFTGAFCLSLEGLLFTIYLNSFAAGCSAETIGSISNGKGVLHGMTRPVAVVAALPFAITLYSSMFLLSGLLATTISVNNYGIIKDQIGAFQKVVLIPVCSMLLCLMIAVAGCEIVVWVEACTKETPEREGTRDGVEKHEVMFLYEGSSGTI